MKSQYPGKKETTNKHIIEKAADLFNRKGYAGTSMSDIMKATGLEKGGIYGHFKSKKEIALAAFEFNIGQIFKSFDVDSLTSKSAVEKLRGIFRHIDKMYDQPHISGGCPLLNTATEADDTDTELLSRVKKYLDKFKKTLSDIVISGVKSKEIRAAVDPEEFAIACIAILEGGNFLTKVYNNKTYRSKAIARIEAMIDSELVRSRV
jgi:TetR/AcrR family transcriptional regulator, transcriptional repressor for nem operon